MMAGAEPTVRQTALAAWTPLRQCHSILCRASPLPPWTLRRGESVPPRGCYCCDDCWFLVAPPPARVLLVPIETTPQLLPASCWFSSSSVCSQNSWWRKTATSFGSSSRRTMLEAWRSSSEPWWYNCSRRRTRLYVQLATCHQPASGVNGPRGAYERTLLSHKSLHSPVFWSWSSEIATVLVGWQRKQEDQKHQTAIISQEKQTLPIGFLGHCQKDPARKNEASTSGTNE